MKAKAAPLFGAIVLCLLTACNGFNQVDALDGSDWVLSSLDGKPPLQGSQVTIKFSEGKLSGSSGCNSYSGSYEVKGDKFSTGQMAMTLMACADAGMMEQEQEFMATLADASSFELGNGQLRIFRLDGKALVFLPE